MCAEPYRLPTTGLWRKVAQGGIYPSGILLGARTRVWSVASIEKLLADLAVGEGGE